MTPTEDELRRWREVAGKATPGEWAAHEECWFRYGVKNNSSPWPIVTAGKYSDEKYGVSSMEDATHIATFNPLTIARLIDAVETLKKENERLKAEIEEWQLAIKATAPK